jgi:hypothetical protein
MRVLLDSIRLTRTLICLLLTYMRLFLTSMGFLSLLCGFSHFYASSITSMRLFLTSMRLLLNFSGFYMMALLSFLSFFGFLLSFLCLYGIFLVSWFAVL